MLHLAESVQARCRVALMAVLVVALGTAVAVRAATRAPKLHEARAQQVHIGHCTNGHAR